MSLEQPTLFPDFTPSMASHPQGGAAAQWIISHPLGQQCPLHPDATMTVVQQKRRHKTYRYGSCRTCKNNYQRNYLRTYTPPERPKPERTLVYKYPRRPNPAQQWKLTRYRLWLDQDQQCAICQRTLTFDQARLDHDHSCCTKDSYSWNGAGWCGTCHRGILCNQCNTAIGLLKDSPPLLRKALHYLQQHTPPTM